MKGQGKVEFELLIKNYLESLFFPKQSCDLCEKPVNSINTSISKNNSDIISLTNICPTCSEHLQIPHDPFCKQCHKPIKSGRVLLCDDCKDSYYKHLVFNRSAVIYNDFMKEKISLYKYRGKESLSVGFSQLLKTAYDQYFNSIDIDYITYVPLHPNRLRERGFNQAEQLAQKLHKFTGIPLLESLERIKDTGKQSKTSKRSRIKQIEAAFIVKEQITEKILAQNILLIDDIYTTGATVNECSKVLKDAGVKNVYSLTLTRAFEERNDDKLDSFV